MRASGAKGYVVAIAAVLVAVGVRTALAPVLGDRSPFLLFTLAVMTASAYGGFGPGIVATVCSMLAGASLFTGLIWSLSTYRTEDLFSLALFAGIGTAISSINSRIHVLQEVVVSEDQKYRLLVDSVTEYAIYGLDPQGNVVSWNAGAERMLGYSAGEIMRRNYSLFHLPEDIAKQLPETALQRAAASGHYKSQDWRVRKDGSRLWADVTITAVRSSDGTLAGFSNVTHDITERKRAEAEVRQLNEELERRVQERTRQLQEANRELEAFSYSVSHDLRAPLRSVDGFGNILLRDYGTALDPRAKDLIRRMRGATVRMGQLIESLLTLSRLSRQPVRRQVVDLGAVADSIIGELRTRDADRKVRVHIQDGLTAECDPRLIRIVLDNLLGNAWKFTRDSVDPSIEFSLVEDDSAVFCVRDNGAGFDMERKDQLFVPFQRLHGAEDFEGTGVGLATAQRIIHRHGGSIWAESQPEKGAAFFFTIK
jgi:PAS domain S-box-containing protein